MSESGENIPIATVHPRRFSLAWLIPLAAILLVASMLYVDLIKDRGPQITIRFADAAGIKQGDAIVHRGLSVGVIRDLRLTKNMTGVIATAELARHAAALAVEGTEFWIVRAELSLERVAGLETLLGPQYIAARPGPSNGANQSEFVGLDTPPAFEPAAGGSLRVTLRADRLGSLSPGAPVLYREIRVGSVRSAALTDDATSVHIAIDIDPRYAILVRDNTRFWRSGGVGFDFGLFKGLSVRADSLSSAISSGISFATPERSGEAPSVPAIFELADSPDEDWLDWAPEIDLGG
ncbi:MAG: MlaD family protein [Phycisphaerales bacterium]